VDPERAGGVSPGARAAGGRRGFRGPIARLSGRFIDREWLRETAGGRIADSEAAAVDPADATDRAGCGDVARHAAADCLEAEALDWTEHRHCRANNCFGSTKL